MSTHQLDVAELRRRLDDRRKAGGLSWRDLALATGVSQSTFTRMKDGRPPSADGLVSLLVWLELDTDLAYLIRPGTPPGEPA